MQVRQSAQDYTSNFIPTYFLSLLCYSQKLNNRAYNWVLWMCANVTKEWILGAVFSFHCPFCSCTMPSLNLFSVVSGTADPTSL